MQLYDLILEGISKSPYKNYEVDEEAIRKTLISDKVEIFTSFEGSTLVGVMIGIITPNPFFKDLLTARELIWYVTECDDRKKHWFDLLDQFEIWSKGEGASPIIGKYPGYEHLEEAYKQLGYNKLSDAFWKEM